MATTRDKTNLQYVGFSTFITQSVLSSLFAVFKDPQIAAVVHKSLPMFCYLVANFEPLLVFTEDEKTRMREGESNSSFLESQQIRETLRSSSLGLLADKLDIRKAQQAYALFNSGISVKRFVELMQSGYTRLSFDTPLASLELDNFAKHVKLNKVEQEILRVACQVAISREFSYLIGEVRRDRTLTRALRRAIFPNISDKQLRTALAADSWLIQSGILSLFPGTELPAVSDTWLEFFLQVDHGDPLKYFFEPAKSTGRGGQLARFERDDATRLNALINKVRAAKSSAAQPTHVLVYGKAHLDRVGLLCNTLGGGEIALLRPNTDLDSNDIQGVVLAGFRAAATQQLNDVVFLVPQAQQVLTRDYTSLIKELFGIEVESEVENLVDEKILSLPVCAIWVQANTKNLHKQTLSRFNLHLRADGASQAEQRVLLEKLVEQSALSENAKMKISRIEGLSEPGLEVALKTAARLHRKGSAAYENTVIDLLLDAQRALGVHKTKVNTLDTTYNLENINARGRFAPQLILDAFGRTHKGTLCLYGLPGTGKTQFVRYMGQVLGLPVLEYKASQLLSKYLGEAEKNISQMFETAQEQGALLFLDEGDSFLRSREHAEKSWEVTMVNELLQQMEGFPGIFVLATNLFRNIDEAALRRFVFKLEFLALSEPQRLRMFEVEAGVQLDSMPEAMANQLVEDLSLMRNLTAGDFATVKRQAQMLGVQLSPVEFVEQLNQEVQFKNNQMYRAAQRQPGMDL